MAYHTIENGFEITDRGCIDIGTGRVWLGGRPLDVALRERFQLEQDPQSDEINLPRMRITVEIVRD